MRRLPRPACRAAAAVAAPRARALCLAAALAAGSGVAGAQGQARFVGELGAGVFASQSIARGHDTQFTVMPYVYGEYGRWFARVDTFGLKTLPLGNGHLELVARFSTEGFKADRPPLTGLRNRANPSPLGLGSAQTLPFGRLFVYAMHDPSSGGTLVEATFGTRVQEYTPPKYKEAIHYDEQKLLYLRELGQNGRDVRGARGRRARRAGPCRG